MSYYNEYEPYAAKWLSNLSRNGHIAPGFVDSKSILDVRRSDIENGQAHFFAGIGVWSYALRQAGFPDDFNIWTGSCPCQPFSQAGKQKGFKDERHLWPAWFKLISSTYNRDNLRPPSVVVGEQVASPDGLRWLELVQADLERAGYAFGAVDTCAAGFGAPHIRQRLYFSAVRLADAAGERGGKIGAYLRGCDERSKAQGLVKRPGYGGSLDESGGLGYAHGEHPGRDAGAGHSSQGGPQLRSGSDITGASGPAHRGLGNSHDAGLEGRRIPAERAGEFFAGASGLVDRPADWLYCRDEKWRPVEPGTQPLVDGFAGRVGALKAYGNALDARQATGFLKALKGALTE